MTQPVWEQLDPLAYNDGVFYVPAMVELQPRLPAWGHPDEPDLRDRLVSDRPHGIGGAKLLCLLCMRHQAQRGLPQAPVWLTFVEGRHGPMFRHEDGRSPHPEHQPETDTHKALKERKARTWASVGGTVEIEVWRPRARRRPDVVAVGPVLTVAGEIQHSKETPRTIRARQRALHKAGDRVVWTTDRGADDITFLHPVPHLSVPALSDHRLYLTEPRLEIGAGAITFETQRCGWADLWTGTSRCPVTRKAVPCGRLHLYPTFNPRSYSRQKAATTAVFPCGPRPHLDHLLEGILHGSWLPYRHRDRVTWIPAGDHNEVIVERGGTVELAENGSAPRRDRTTERACERRYGTGIAQGAAPEVENLPLCCGEKPPGRAGQPLILACQLCRNSPTYYRRDELNA
ncbi:competence protein CoiA family protein [Micromonospora sp. ZYX-F-536]|uniref:competence protein CoiA family protein n=1 Tax=Micromonospora sp. ZYX-F-536 TaxID=3457629 RepID=UPI0040408B22